MERVLVGLVCAFLCGCGFVDEPRLTQPYIDKCASHDEGAAVVMMPIHGVAIAGCAVIDQGLRTVTTFWVAGRDTVDYVLYPIPKEASVWHDVMYFPKTVTGPVVFVGSYLTRWWFPVPAAKRPFAPP